jgi:ABC-type polysaccharide/polyol phosphate export permease
LGDFCQILVIFGVQLGMYATPVIYPIPMVPAKYRWLILANTFMDTV